MKKKLIAIIPVLLVLVLNILFNGVWSDKAVQARKEAAPSPAPTAASTSASTADPSPSPKATPKPTPTPPPTPSPEELLRQESQKIADYSLKFWGAKYKYGGDSLEEGGFDCSGLVYHCYGMAGYSLERVAAQQAKQGVEVPPEELWPGDVLCFKTSGNYVGHVGIYLGEGYYIHAMGEEYGVVVNSLEDPYLKRTFTARRFVGCEELKTPPPAETEPAQAETLSAHLHTQPVAPFVPAAYALSGSDSASPAAPITIAVATDMHYLSPGLVVGGELIRQMSLNGDGKMNHISPEIFQAFLCEMEKSAPDILIISGDMTLNGAKASHEDFVRLLAPLEKKGTDVLIIPGNHDIDKEFAVNYIDDGAVKAEALSFEAFRTLYADFGPDIAISSDGQTFSYTVQAGKGLRIIMLDTNSYGSGTIKSPTLQWLEQQLEEAQAAGDKVITVSHQNLYAHNRLLSFGYELYNSDALLALLEQYGVICHLSGHIHSQSIKEGAVPEIVTSSLVVAPCQYGLIEYDGSSLSYGTAETDVSLWAEAEGRTEPEFANFAAFCRKFFADNCYRQMNEMFEGSALSEEDVSLLSDTFAQLNQDYFAGALPDYAALQAGIELWRAQEKSFTQMYIETMAAIEHDSRTYEIAVN